VIPVASEFGCLPKGVATTGASGGGIGAGWGGSLSDPPVKEQSYFEGSDASAGLI
jgi:hypothetical protein